VISGCKTTDVGFSQQDKLPLLSQDLSSLSNSNGKIVYAKTVKVKSNWSDKVESYKIKYLSDGLKVVGFVVKPKAEGLKFPAIIFNRGGNREFAKIDKGYLKYFSYISAQNYVIVFRTSLTSFPPNSSLPCPPSLPLY
jgi:dipeptidyl aminopeptidase/acylaminoacyl peptidase